MKKLNKSTSKNLTRLAEEIREKIEALGAAIDEINELRAELAEELDGLAADAESYYDERSERWQEGDAGQAYEGWKDKLRELAESAADEIEGIEEPEWVEEALSVPESPEDM